MTDADAAAILFAASAEMPCAYCGEIMQNTPRRRTATKDHVWPKHMRSIDKKQVGIVWCCGKCNLEKGNMSPAQWLAYMRRRPDRFPKFANE